MVIKDLVPGSLRPVAKRLQVGAGRAVKVMRTSATSVPNGPVLIDASIADEYAMTFLVASRMEISGLIATVTSKRVERQVTLRELHRYQQEGRWFVLASLVFDEPVCAGDRIGLACDRGDVSVAWAAIRETRDAAHPLIERLALSNSKGQLSVISGKPRPIEGPVLLGVDWSAELEGVHIATDVPLVAAQVHVRSSDSYRDLPSAGPGFLVPAEMLAEVGSELEGESALLGIMVTGEDGAAGGLGHRDPWVRHPRNYETFAPLVFPWVGRIVSVRPYWSLGGRLALKVRSN